MATTTYSKLPLEGAVGKPIVRRSGRAKVTGTAPFTAERNLPGLLHAVAVPSTIARGKIRSIDTSSAEKMTGVRVVITPDNVPEFKRIPTFNEAMKESCLASHVYPAAEREVFYAGQFVAAVVADTFEAARDAALAVKIEYEPMEHVTSIEEAPADERPKSLFGAPPVIEIGDAVSAFDLAEVKVDVNFDLAMNHHNPIEPHAALAHWSHEGGKEHLTVFETTQSLSVSQKTYEKLFSLQPEQVRVICEMVGGAFGSKGSMWPHSVLACFCARVAGAPVKLVVTRQQLFGGTGHRTPMKQRVALGANRDGTIKAIIHEGVATTSEKDSYAEAFTMATRMMYQTESLRLAQTQSRIHTQSPTFMRAPAETPGMFALEAAIDELASELGIDPIVLRVRNEPEKSLYEDKPFSGRHLVECLQKGAEAFGWNERPREPRSQRDGDWLIGTGVASATYPAMFFPTQARVTLRAGGTAHIDCCSQELGTGTVTTQCQLLASQLRISASRVSMNLGDTSLPPGGISGGSATAASVGGAVRAAVDALRKKLIELAPSDSSLAQARVEDVSFKEGMVSVASQSWPLEELLSGKFKDEIAAVGQFKAAKDSKTSNHSYGAQFVEVAVDEELGLVRVRRMLGCFACGTILNAKTGRSQFLGGMIMGVGHALHEKTVWDHRLGRIANDNIAEYHVPVNADIPDMEIMWIDEPDFNASPVGAKGIGEIGITGVAAAIANAIYHATGRRYRDLPITPEKIII
ncbi:xanthine dehydrogenase family protein molybdopterin-binding subunit [Rubinisphaera margarita]|uniref:xanthine dehydrogenase family protein molybdopterin-binding subunit n=1 Tax=Rubinisphaera margarita TaxID=2909586 RepID=UPI001EE982F3|nr:xanthine dehydrogenase family protein molybdopterin-binding subunit [Rubinisphaera margarita]MCG6156488.1 xanthine dehydrogenase family protein molybdopterin-binding subunit [Rubinisphaera margarita]